MFLGRQMNRVKEYSEHTARHIDNEVRAILTRAYGTARHILEANLHILHAVAGHLIERETLDADEFAEMVDSLEPNHPGEKWWSLLEPLPAPT